MKAHKDSGAQWLKLNEIAANSQVQSFGINEIDVVRWAKEEKISYRVFDGRKKYDLHEVIGFALALSNGWLFEEEPEDEEPEDY